MRLAVSTTSLVADAALGVAPPSALRMLHPAISALLCVFAFASLLRAEPLDRRQLPAGAKWFVHVDLDAASASTLGRAMRLALLARPEARDVVDKSRQTLGIDLTRDVRSFTVFGSGFAADAGVLIVRGKVDRPKLLDLLKTMPGYATQVTGGREFYFWTEQTPAVESNPSSSHPPRASVGTFFGDDTVVIAPGAAPLSAAMDVLEGKAAALPSDDALVTSCPPGTVVLAGAAGLAEARDLPVQSPILRQCESGTLSIGEFKGQAFLRGALTTRAAETASQVRAAIDGICNIAKLQALGNEDAGRVLNAFKVDSSERTVSVAWEMGSGEVIRIVQAQVEHGRWPAGAASATAPQPGKAP